MNRYVEARHPMTTNNNKPEKETLSRRWRINALILGGLLRMETTHMQQHCLLQCAISFSLD
eukprot:scaffold54995_cov65-Attheya_sp.AAC.1